MNEWYTIDNADTVDTPALAVYPDRVKENIRILKTFVPDLARLRPHVKTNKSEDVSRLFVEAGITRFKCATIAEAEMLAIAGANDVLLAYQPVGPKAHRLLALVNKYAGTLFSCLIDTFDCALGLSDIFSEAGKILPVYIDLNVGMNRTGIVPDQALALFEACRQLKGISVVGLHAYDGHIRDADFELRTQNCDRAFQSVEKLKSGIEAKYPVTLKLVAGGTPTFPIHARRANTECSPGTFIYWDMGYRQLLKEQPFLFSALVITRVISKPTADTLCLDLGHKSIASENPIDKRVFFLNGPDLQPSGHSEEHLVVKVPATNQYRVGDVFYGVPYHICPTVALYDAAVVVEQNQATGHWLMRSRNRTITV